MNKICIHIGVLFIIAGFSLMCINVVSASMKNYYADIDKSKEIVKNVDKNYKLFKQNAANVKDSIIQVSKSFNIYLSDYMKKKESIVEKINLVEKNIQQLDNISLELVSDCKYNLNNAEMNQQCSSFKINYKNMISSYNEMIDEYNYVIDSYNGYAKNKKKKQAEKYENNLGENVVKILNGIK